MKALVLALVILAVLGGCAPATGTPAPTSVTGATPGPTATATRTPTFTPTQTPTATPQVTSFQHFNNSIQLSNQAARITLEAQGRRIPEEDMKRFIDLSRQALAEAKLVDIEQLNRAYPGLGTHYRDEFLNGLALGLEVYDTKDFNKAAESQALTDRWFTWYSQNIEDMRRSTKLE